MTGPVYEVFLSSVIGLCGLMAVVNLLLFKRRGASAYFLAGAFLLLGGTVALFKAQIEGPWVAVGGALTALCLFGDLYYRPRP